MRVSTILLTGSILAGTAVAAHADILGIQNNAAFGNGKIVTVDLTTNTIVNSFIPDQAKIGTANGRAVEVLGNFIYYTELTNGFGSSSGIFVAPFNNGAGGHDIKSFANPVPNTGIVDLAAANGKLYAMTGYPTGPEVIQATDGNGTNIGGPITLTTLSGGHLSGSDGFTVLANGNFLINSGDGTNSYNQYDPTTGIEITGTTVVAAGCGTSTGVDNNGTNLVFDCNLNSLEVTDFSGVLISKTFTGTSGGEDISLVQAGPITPPSMPEPASIAVLGVGLLGLGLIRRKSS